MSVMISIHAPHTGRDSGVSVTGAELCEFQSTRPIRGATLMLRKTIVNIKFQSTRPIRGATWHTAARWMEGKIFQSTRPIRGATGQRPAKKTQYGGFQSTRPIRGATPWFCRLVPSALYFNPRAPYGARRDTLAPLTRFTYFNPRAPYRARPLEVGYAGRN